MKDSKTRKSFDDRLFGAVYPELGWDKGCICPYYLRWKDLNTPVEREPKVVRRAKATKSAKHT